MRQKKTCFSTYSEWEHRKQKWVFNSIRIVFHRTIPKNFESINHFIYWIKPTNQYMSDARFQDTFLTTFSYSCLFSVHNVESLFFIFQILICSHIFQKASNNYCEKFRKSSSKLAFAVSQHFAIYTHAK